MKPTIRKKDKDKLGNQRYILEWEENGKIRSFALKPDKLLDLIKKSKLKEEKN